MLNVRNISQNMSVPHNIAMGLNNVMTMSGKFLGIVCQDPSDSKSSWLHVDIIRFCFHLLKVYSSIDSSKMIGKFVEVSNFNRLLFLKLNWFIVCS